MKKILALLIFISLFTACKKDKNISTDTKKNGEKTEQKVEQKFVSTKKVQKNGVATILPEDLIVLAKFNSLESLYRNLSINGRGIFGFNPLILKDIKEQFGFNPLILKDMEELGVDSKREIGYALLDLNIAKESASMLVFIPVTDGKKLISKWGEILKKTGMELSEVDGFTNFKIDEISFYIKEKDGFIFLIFNPTEDVLTHAKAIFQKKTLSSSEKYGKIGERAGSGESFYLYANFSTFFATNSEKLKEVFEDIYHGMGGTIPVTMVSLLNSYQAMGVSVDFEKSDFIVTWVAGVDKNSKINDLMKDISFKKERILGIKSEPLFILSFALNPIAYWDLVKSMFREHDIKDMNRSFAEMKAETGVDFIEDILKNLGGNFNMGMFDVSTMNLDMFAVNFAGDFTVKDSKKAEEILVKLSEKAENRTVEEIGGVKTQVFNLMVVSLYVGVKGEHVIYSVNKKLYEDMILGDKSKGFLSSWDSKKPKTELESDSRLRYFNFDELVKMINASPSISQDVWKSTMNLLVKFDYTIMNASKDESIWFGDFILKTKFKEPFLLELKPLVVDIAKEDGYEE